MRKIIPPKWDIWMRISPEWDFGRMVYFTLQKQIIYMRMYLSNPGKILPQRR